MSRIQEIKERMLYSQRQIERRRKEILGIIEKPMPTLIIPSKREEGKDSIEQENEDTEDRE